MDKILQKIAGRLERYALRMRYTRLGLMSVIEHIDCVKTIEVLLKLYKPQIVYDIGANGGQWSYILKKLQPELVTAVLFEPQKNYYTNASELFKNEDTVKLFNLALGSTNGSMEITGGTASASLLQPSKYQEYYFPGTIQAIKEKVDVVRLDDFVKKVKLPQPDTAKLDVQGYELEVFTGGEKTLSACSCLIVELSFQMFYDGQPPLSQLLAWMEKHDFRLSGIGYQLRSKTGNAIVSIDGIFLKGI